MTVALRSLILPVAGFALAAATVTYAAHEFMHARSQHDAAIASFNAVRADTQEVVRLRGMVQRINDRPRPEQDMIARLHDAMQQAGLDVPRHFQSLRLESDVELPGMALGAQGSSTSGGGLRRQAVAVSLGNLSLPQFGGLLLEWKRDQPLWDITRLEMTHVRGVSRAAEADRYDVSLTFSAIYAAPAPGPDQGGAS